MASSSFPSPQDFQGPHSNPSREGVCMYTSFHGFVRPAAARSISLTLGKWDDLYPGQHFHNHHTCVCISHTATQILSNDVKALKAVRSRLESDGRYQLFFPTYKDREAQLFWRSPIRNQSLPTPDVLCFVPTVR